MKKGSKVLGIFNRLPKQKEIAPVYAVIVLIIYGWSILHFEYQLPGWLYFQSIDKILAEFAYVMATNLFESLTVLLGVVVLAFVLPSRWFSDMFVARGVSLSALILGLMMYIANQFATKQDYPAEVIRWAPAILLGFVILAYLIGLVKPIAWVIETFSDRAIIFLYITIPVSIVSIVVILFRLIF